MTRDHRIATLVVVPLVAAAGSVIAGRHHALAPAGPVLIAMWIGMTIALCARVALAGRGPHPAGSAPEWGRGSIEARKRGPAVTTGWDHLDVLTATGSAVMWSSAAALVLGGVTGWASLSVIGVLGLGAVYLAASWTVLVAGGDAPWRRATITRQILPEVCTEGDALREELELIDVWIPPGMRLFATGRATTHGATTRYAVGSEGSRAELRLGSALGPAPRGEHVAPPLTLWLRDVLGLTRTPVIARGEARFSVRPRAVEVIGARALLGPGGDDALAVPAQRQPTEGSFRIRAYVPGDDTRRIHWVRSLQANELVVRLPDELPPADPVVRVILDNELRGTEELTCDGPNQLLDGLVRVWLGLGRALAETGTRVVLVTAAPQHGGLAIVERPLISRASDACVQLGARVRWQGELALDRMLAREPVLQIVVSSRPRPVAGAVAWIVLPEIAWTKPELDLPAPHSVQLPFPSGSADNRRGRRVRERLRVESIWQDRAVFSQILCWTDWGAYAGHHLARQTQRGVELELIR